MPIRQRPRHGLYPLWEGLQFTPTNARCDKLELTIPGRLYMPAIQMLPSLQGALAEQEHPLFAAPTGRAFPRRTQRIRKGWLFGGRLKFLPETFSLGGMEVLLRLELNPTRFAAHGSFIAQDLVDLRSVPPDRLLTRSADVTAQLRRLTLDGNDNFIPDGPWLGEVTEEWQSLMSFYVRSALDLVQHRIEQAPLDIVGGRCTASFPVSRLNPPRLGRVEVHCEIREPRAVLAMTAIGDTAIAELPRIVRRGGDFSIGRMRGAPWLQLHVRKGVSLSVYAKTRDRIRVEVAYSPRPQLSLGTLPLPGNRFPAGMEYQTKLRRLMADATTRINSILPVLVGEKPLGSKRAAVALADFLVRVATIAGRPKQPSRRQAIVDAVLAGQVVARTEDPLFQAASHLAVEGILERTLAGVSSPPVFRPSPKYRELVDRLQTVAFGRSSRRRRG